MVNLTPSLTQSGILALLRELEAVVAQAEAAVDAAFERLAAADARLAALVELLEDQGDLEPEEDEPETEGTDRVFDDPRLAGLDPAETEVRVAGIRRASQLPDRSRESEIRIWTEHLDSRQRGVVMNLARVEGVPLRWIAGQN